MIVGRGRGLAALVGPRPMELPLSLRVACETCDAPTGERCRTWRKQDGERIYIKGYRVKPHPERTEAARVAGNGAA